jgi:hypothetical protein
MYNHNNRIRRWMCFMQWINHLQRTLSDLVSSCALHGVVHETPGTGCFGTMQYGLEDRRTKSTLRRCSVDAPCKQVRARELDEMTRQPQLYAESGHEIM